MSDKNTTKFREKLSKRVAGGIFLLVALLMTGHLYYTSIEIKIADAGTSTDLIKMCLYAGSALFGLDVAGKFSKK